MSPNKVSDHKLLFIYNSITWGHFALIQVFMHFNKYSLNIGLYEYTFLLITFFAVDLLKLILASSQLEHISIGRQDLNYTGKSRKSNRILKNFLKFIVATVGITVIYHAVIVLFGAPFFDDYDKTFILASTLTMLTLVPASLHLGIDNALALFIGYPVQINGPFVDFIKFKIKTVLFGTWISAFVFPLDWDRPWQAWPIPCVAGALIGYFAAHFISTITVLFNLEKKASRRATTKNC